MMSWDVNLGNILVTTGLGVVGYGLKRIHAIVAGFVNRVDVIDHRVEAASDMVDLHTDILRSNKLAGHPMPYVGKRRRRTDWDDLTSGLSE